MHLDKVLPNAQKLIVLFDTSFKIYIQLSAARAENEVLKEQVKTLKQRCSVLTVENEALKAEVEMYRSEAALAGTSSNSSAPGTAKTLPPSLERDHFVKSGDGNYAKCKTKLSLALWNAENRESATTTVECDAPVIAVDFSRNGRTSKFVAAGCMDGSVHVVYLETDRFSNTIQTQKVGSIQHGKYVKCVAWSATDNILATASADGSVQVHKLEWNFVDATGATLEKVQQLQLSGAVESLCFREDTLCAYARGSSNLICFDLQDNFAQQKINLNRGPGNACFDDHVSFAVMDMSVFQNDYLALATDSSRNIVMDWRSGNQVRNLYGHKNDSYSQPKLAWSQNGQYLYGNSQHESTICVWDIASSSIVERLEGHSNTIRDMYSSSRSDTLVTTSFDKKTQFWTTEEQ